MLFQVYFRNPRDNRAPSSVDLRKDYQHAGEVQAVDRKELARKLLVLDDLDIEQPRPFQVGDVIIDEKKDAYIYTPLNIWALVAVS
jgi:hypothetical protein